MLQNLPEIIPQCPVCLQPFASDSRSLLAPIILTDCGHSICNKCLTRLKDQKDLKCPECKKKFSSQNSICNFSLIRVVENLQPRNLVKSQNKKLQAKFKFPKVDGVQPQQITDFKNQMKQCVSLIDNRQQNLNRFEQIVNQISEKVRENQKTVQLNFKKIKHLVNYLLKQIEEGMIAETQHIDLLQKLKELLYDEQFTLGSQKLKFQEFQQELIKLGADGIIYLSKEPNLIEFSTEIKEEPDFQQLLEKLDCRSDYQLVTGVEKQIRERTNNRFADKITGAVKQILPSLVSGHHSNFLKQLIEKLINSLKQNTFKINIQDLSSLRKRDQKQLEKQTEKINKKVISDKVLLQPQQINQMVIQQTYTLQSQMRMMCVGSTQTQNQKQNEQLLQSNESSSERQGLTLGATLKEDSIQIGQIQSKNLRANLKIEATQLKKQTNYQIKEIFTPARSEKSKNMKLLFSEKKSSVKGQLSRRSNSQYSMHLTPAMSIMKDETFDWPASFNFLTQSANTTTCFNFSSLKQTNQKYIQDQSVLILDRNPKQSFLQQNMSVCQIEDKNWFATSQLSQHNCYEIIYTNDILKVNRLFSTCKPRVGNHLICVGDYIYNIGGKVQGGVSKMMQRLSKHNLEGKWEDMIQMKILCENFCLVEFEEKILAICQIDGKGLVACQFDPVIGQWSSNIPITLEDGQRQFYDWIWAKILRKVENNYQILVLLSPKINQYSQNINYCSQPTELYLLTIPSGMPPAKEYKLQLLCKMKENRELKSNVCYYQQSLYVFGGNPNGTIECLKNVETLQQITSEILQFQGQQLRNNQSNNIGLLFD